MGAGAERDGGSGVGWGRPERGRCLVACGDGGVDLRVGRLMWMLALGGGGCRDWVRP